MMKAKHLITIIFLMVGLFGSYAAGPPKKPPGGSGGPGCWPPPCVPIDGGISLLIAAGAIYGGKKLYNKQKIDKKHL